MGILVGGPPAPVVLGLPITMVISAVVIYSDIGRGGVQVLGVLIAIAGIAVFFLGILVKDTMAERSSVEW
jgi:C4-dicarboxylate transporter